ncbi:MAG: hypothetical protein RR614_16245, partial [Eubacterium sp.]
ESYCIAVEDDGVGAESRKSEGGSGIDNVRSRLESQCGGILMMNGAADVGMTVEIVIPKSVESKGKVESFR